MAKAATRYVCQSCGAGHAQWAGRCDACGAWNTLVEEAGGSATPKGLGKRRGGRRLELADLSGAPADAPRRASGLGEFDRVCGGGLVPGSAVLVGGDPGIGKSTLMLQVTARLAGAGLRAVYISGEEAVDQIRLRAGRMGLSKAPLALAMATGMRDIIGTLEAGEPPDVVVIDSIQTMFLDTLESAPGTVSQVRASAQELIGFAKRRGAVVLLVGHVTKDGQIAGPRVLEHMVDTVLWFEGERGHHFRILRAVKNRFGPTDEIGVFEMTDSGLSEVANPSALFLGDRAADATAGAAAEAVSGSAVFAGMEGTRPLLVEIQALAAPSAYGTPRRAVVGWDGNRLAMILAVLEARCGLAFAGRDVYLNVAGGLRIAEPAADLAVAAALVSALCDRPLPPDTVVFGEISLSGEIRSVSQTENRLREAARLGFARAIAPRRRKGGNTGGLPEGVEELGRLHELVARFEPAPGLRPAAGFGAD